MKHSTELDREITDKRQLVEWLEAGCKPSSSQLLIGAENEKIVFRQDTLEPPAYEGSSGIHALLEGFKRFGWEREGSADQELTSLRRGAASLSIELSGFLELSGTAVPTVHDLASELDQHICEAVEICADLGLGLLALGFHPTMPVDRMPHMPMERAESLIGEVARFSSGSVHVPMQTASAQISLDFTSEEDMREKLRVALSLQPVIVALFANSPFSEARPSGYLSYRSHVSQNSFGGRYGFMLPEAFDPAFGFESYVDYTLSKPLFGLFRGQHFVPVVNKPFATYLNDNERQLAGQPVTLNDWVDHLNSIWPEVRLRRSLEMRGADSCQPEMIKALAAFWTGVLYDKSSLDQAWQMVRDWTAEDREYLRTETPRTALQTPFLGTTVQEFAKNALALAAQGLKNRALTFRGEADERVYLAPLFEVVHSGITPAQRLLESFNREWKGDVTKVFEVARYNAPAREKLRGFSL